MRESTLWSIVLSICLLLGSQAYAKDYYIDSHLGKDNNDGSRYMPWQSLHNLDGFSFNPGDHIYFARGSEFTGGFRITASGEPDNPILFSCYGQGAAPRFTNPNYDTFNGNVFQIHGSHIVIEGLSFYHTANYTGKAVSEDQKRGNDRKILLIGAIYQVTGANDLTVRNAEFNDCPIGIYINGQHNLITQNYFHDCNRFLWSPDWGPIALVVGNAYNEISYNRCTNYVKEGGNFGADGGFIELDSRYYGGPIHDLKIHHNYSWANEGFMEVTNAGKNLHIYYNVSDDFQQFIFFWSGDSSLVDHNTVIRTRPANSTVNVVLTFRKNGFQFRNNIFVVADSLQVFGSGAYDAWNFDQLHENNIYYAIDGSYDPVGKPLGKGEFIANPQFIDDSNHNYRLQSTSPCIDKATSMDYSRDIDHHGVPYGQAADLGAYEFQGTPQISKS